ARALELDDAMQPFMVSDRPRGVLAVRLMHAGKLDEARRTLLRLLDEAKMKGDELSASDISNMLGRLERLAGNWKTSLEYHTSGSLPGEASALPQRALVLAHMGETARAEAEASKALEAPFRKYDLGL